MLTSFADDIWIADGSDLSVMGFTYPTRCAVMRLQRGDLLVWSPIALHDVLKAQIDALGTVSHLIAPNMFHHMFLSEWQAAYPKARLYGLSGLHSKRSDLRFNGVLGDDPDAAWANQIDQIVLNNNLTDEVVFFHQLSRTVIFTDLIQQFSTGFHTGWRGVIARLDLMVGDIPNVPRKFRLGFRNKAKARASVEKVLDWPIERVLLAHGTPVTADGHAVLKRTFHWLIG
ncbi:DUF4336 domain-containing protein [Yoonia sp. F2084L]|uniref:DUF4336 domain-containing protein n=1 Tax=Yoonia sp. F2084L TaxID=2926419 RepID=UPI001FF2453D|nr:DUF4336 domain-containing protein [Yoonia sp. F2084L]MCK0094542.1 DUF4336 domain-containing protein [Yoonia sp. F2084L]